MNANKIQLNDNDCININVSLDAAYWCEKFSISPFTLYQLIKSFGNSATKIADVLAKGTKPGTLSMKEQDLIDSLNKTIDVSEQTAILFPELFTPAESDSECI